MNDFMKIGKSLKKSGLLMEEVGKKIQNKGKEQMGDFWKCY